MTIANCAWWKKVFVATIALLFIGGLLFLGMFIGSYYWLKQMQGYDVVNCIENNAASNGFPKHPAMIEKIQQECLCFKEKGYNSTRILEEGC